jgi:hypothetical protein
MHPRQTNRRPLMPRAIDHLVHAVRDLDAARAAYQRMGFTLTPVARHPFGTKNSLVQLHGGFLELLAVDDPTLIVPPAEGHFSFAAFNRDYLREREGLSMLVLRSADPAADRAAFAAGGLPVYQPFGFERIARGPDGVERKVAFALTFTSDARVHGAAGFFTCQSLFPENFWRAEFQRHANGAGKIASAVFVSRDPADFHIFFTVFTGQHDMTATSLGVLFDLGGSELELLSPPAFRAFFGENAGEDPRRFTAFRIAVADLAAVRARFTAEAVPFTEHAGALVVPATYAHGVAIAFVAA